MKQLWLVLLTTVLANAAQASPSKFKIYSQDHEYIYRKVPIHIDLTDSNVTKHILDNTAAGVIEAAKKTLKTMKLGESIESQFERFEKRVDKDNELLKSLDDLNAKAEDYLNRKEYTRDPQMSDIMPKALMVFAGGKASLAWKVGAGVSLVGGFIVMRDQVHRIKKSSLYNHEVEEFTTAIENFDEGGLSNLWEAITGQNDGLVTTYTEFDIAPALFLAPNIAVGAGGGTGIRIGAAAFWWAHDKIIEPENLFGWGVAYSQDYSLGVGRNFKIGPMNSRDVEGIWDYTVISASMEFGATIEAKPAKLDVMYIDTPATLMKRLGFESGGLGNLMKEVAKSIGTALNNYAGAK